MPEDRGGTVRQIAWHDVFPWLSLVRAVRLAATPRLILLAALGLALTAVGWRGIGWAFSNSDEVAATGWREADYSWPWESPAQRYGAPLLSLQRFNPLVSPVVRTRRMAESAVCPALQSVGRRGGDRLFAALRFVGARGVGADRRRDHAHCRVGPGPRRPLGNLRRAEIRGPRSGRPISLPRWFRSRPCSVCWCSGGSAGCF